MLHVKRAVLIATAVSVGCGSPTAGTGRAPAPNSPAVVAHRAATDAEPMLRSYPAAVSPPPVALAAGRNPFRFGPKGTIGNRGSGSALPPLPPPDGLPELPLPIARPALRLLGLVTTEDGQTVAVINMGSDLVLVRKGEQFGRRFSLTSIADDAVELSDAIGNQPIRLTLP